LGRWLRPVAAGLAVIAAVVTAIVLLGPGGDDGSDRASGPAASPPAKDAPAKSGGAPSPRRLAAWPNRSAFTVVIYANDAGRARARALARRAVRFGYVAGVLNSSDHPDLEPGKVVGFAGLFRSNRQARRAARRLKAQGVAGAPYVIFIRRPE
jgi:hypothetical protein